MKEKMLSVVRRSVAVAVLAALSAVLTGEDVWTSHGPADIGWVSDVAVLDSTALAATRNGIFRSDDQGATWRPSGLVGQPLDRIVARSGAPAAFARGSHGYLSDSGPLFVSRDGGQTWEATSLADVLGVALDPRDLSTVYAATRDGRLARSTDAGRSWQYPSRIPADEYGMDFALDSSGLYVLTLSGLHKSVDGGASWTGVTQPEGYGRRIFVGKTGALYVVAEYNLFCRSTDGAATWTCSAFPAYVPSALILELDEGGGSVPLLLATHSGGLLSSRDGGATWTETLAGSTHDAAQTHGLVSDESGSVLLAGTETGVLRSLDRGATWTSFSAGLQSAWIDAVAPDPQDGSRIWAGGLAGLFRSSDAGLSWSPVARPGAPEIHDIAVDPERSSTVYVASDRVYRTDDDGATWSASPTSPSARSLHVDPASPASVWAVGGQIYKSEDGARTWRTFSNLSQHIYCALVDQKQPGTIYAGSYFDTFEYFGYDYPRGGAIFVSRDRGATFTKNSTDFGSHVNAIIADPHEQRVLFAITYFAVFRSGDDGATWQRTQTSPPQFLEALVADPVRPAKLYVGTTEGVYRTLDGGQTWSPFGASLAGSPVSKLAISPDGRALFAGMAGGGVYQLDLQAEGQIPCVPSPTRLCLSGNRYAVDLIAGRRGETPSTPGTARTLADRAGYFSLPFATGDAGLPEVVVKVLGEGALGLDGAPVFYSSLTTLPYRLLVTDTHTGATQFYPSDVAHPLCGAVDVAFEPGAAAAPILRAGASGENALPLLNGRFSVALEARRPSTGAKAAGRAIASGDRYGFFTLPGFTSDPTLPEVIVKMLDYRSITGSYLFFYTGLTSLDYTLTMTDTVTGTVRTYESPGDYCGAVHADTFAN